MTVVDLGAVRYEPPLSYSMPHGRQPTVLWTGPRWLRNPSRWHRVRSGVQYPHFDHATYHVWCGQTITSEKPATVELPTDGAPLCGTCEGRAAGAGHPSPITPGVELRFDPERLIPPRWCPGGGPYGPARHVGEMVGHKVVRCGACGELVAEINAYGWNPRAGVPRRHEPGPGLVPGCPLHAWRHLTRTVEGVACQCAGLEAA
jgi:hypothetical protein